MTKDEQVAVCFSGLLNVNVVDSGRNIRQNLVDPFSADVFIAGTYPPGGHVQCASDKNRTTAGCLWHGVRHLEPITRRDLQPMLSVALLQESMERLPHWPAVVAAFHKHRQRYQNLSVWSPVLGTERAGVLRQYYDYFRVLTLLRREEAARRAPYTRVVYSRLEFEWILPHPPLAVLLQRPDVTWLPWTGLDGVNDRHAFMPRAHADRYLTRWNLLRSPRLLELLDSAAAVMMVPEVFALVALQTARVPYGFYPLPAFLSCCRAGHTAPHLPNCFNAACYWTSLRGRALWGKYPAELRFARHHALLMSACRGAALRVATDASEPPGCGRDVLQIVVPGGSEPSPPSPVDLPVPGPGPGDRPLPVNRPLAPCKGTCRWVDVRGSPVAWLDYSRIFVPAEDDQGHCHLVGCFNETRSGCPLRRVAEEDGRSAALQREAMLAELPKRVKALELQLRAGTKARPRVNKSAAVELTRELLRTKAAFAHAHAASMGDDVHDPTLQYRTHFRLRQQHNCSDALTPVWAGPAWGEEELRRWDTTEVLTDAALQQKQQQVPDLWR